MKQSCKARKTSRCLRAPYTATRLHRPSLEQGWGISLAEEVYKTLATKLAQLVVAADFNKLERGLQELICKRRQSLTAYRSLSAERLLAGAPMSSILWISHKQFPMHCLFWFADIASVALHTEVTWMDHAKFENQWRQKFGGLCQKKSSILKKGTTSNDNKNTNSINSSRNLKNGSTSNDNKITDSWFPSSYKPAMVGSKE